jgi:hypothetical protein
MTESGAPRASRFASRLSAEVGYALGGALRGGVDGRLALPYLLDISTHYSFFLEATEEGLVAAALGRISAELRLIDDPVAQLRLGGGIRHFHDSLGGVVGGDGLIALDLFPIDPVVVSTELGIGFVGEAVVVSARGTVGAIFDSTEIYAGYHYEGLFAGGEHVDLGGPILGVRAWL